jgi:hypothetical protein
VKDGFARAVAVQVEIEEYPLTEELAAAFGAPRGVRIYKSKIFY